MAPGRFFVRERLREPDANERKRDDGVAGDLQGKVDRRMQQRDQRHGEGGERNAGTAARAAQPPRENDKRNQPSDDDNRRERNSELGSELEGRRVRKIPYAPHRNVRAAIGGESLDEDSQASHEPWTGRNQP